MICNMPFIVSIGDFSRSADSVGSLAISKVFRSQLIEVSCDEPPNKEISNLLATSKIVQLLGDAAKLHRSGISWLDALGAWKVPVILVVQPLHSGEIPGSAFAYVSLCKTLSVPLVGLVQLGGVWDPSLRRLDCLPWCGYLSNDLLDDQFNWANMSDDEYTLMNQLGSILRQRMISLDL